MTSDHALYRDLAYVFIAALLGGVIAKRLRQPLIIGYVLGGIFIGPFTPGPTISDIHVLELFAEIGVILLMYSIGIEFSIRDLLQVKWVSLVGGPLGILAVIALSVAMGRLLGWSTLQSIAIGAVVSLASTMVLSRLLMDRGELHSQHGRVMIGITLVDDLAFVVMIGAPPCAGQSEPGPPVGHRLCLWQGALDTDTGCLHRGQTGSACDGACSTYRSGTPCSCCSGAGICDRGCHTSAWLVLSAGSLFGWNDH